MAQAKVTKTLEASPDAVWKCVEDFGGVGWLPGGGAGAEIEGSGPGMTRILQGPDGKIRETLESVDEATRSLTYVIPVGVPFPVTGYRATMRVSDDGGKGRVEWTCEFDGAECVFPLTMEPDETARIDLTYAPLAVGSHDGTLTFATNVALKPEVYLSFSGRAENDCKPEITCGPTTVRFRDMRLTALD